MEKIKSFILHLRNPCRKCLVVAACSNKDNCEPRCKYESIREITSELTEVSIVLGILFFIGLTFVLGFYKWYEILRKVF
jgi:hypothetical protein